MRSIIQHTFAEELKNNSGDGLHQTQNHGHHVGMSLAMTTIDQENMIAVDDEEEYEDDARQYGEVDAKNFNR